MATVYWTGGSAPVKVRDLSSGGALIEGAPAPPTGTLIRLCRGRLEVEGHVIWQTERRAGIKFKSAITVSDWLPRGTSQAPQQRVDMVVHQSKVGSTNGFTPHPEVKSRRFSSFSAAELSDLSLAVNSLAEDLAEDSTVVQRHQAKLQTLDLVSQAFAVMAAERLANL